jgi:hypothetical protein
MAQARGDGREVHAVSQQEARVAVSQEWSDAPLCARLGDRGCVGLQGRPTAFNPEAVVGTATGWYRRTASPRGFLPGSSPRDGRGRYRLGRLNFRPRRSLLLVVPRRRSSQGLTTRCAHIASDAPTAEKRHHRDRTIQRPIRRGGDRGCYRGHRQIQYSDRSPVEIAVEGVVHTSQVARRCVGRGDVAKVSAEHRWNRGHMIAWVTADAASVSTASWFRASPSEGRTGRRQRRAGHQLLSAPGIKFGCASGSAPRSGEKQSVTLAGSFWRSEHKKLSCSRMTWKSKSRR